MTSIYTDLVKVVPTSSKFDSISTSHPRSSVVTTTAICQFPSLQASELIDGIAVVINQLDGGWGRYGLVRDASSNSGVALPCVAVAIMG